MTDRTVLPIRGRLAVLAAAATLIATACGGGSGYGGVPAAPSASSPSAPASGSPQRPEIDVANDPTLGAYLTGADGRTLYVFMKDSAGKSACTGQCAQNWPALTLAAGEDVRGGPGVSGTLATITRDDGTIQVTYDGAPLYYFAGDKSPGDTTGQGLNGVWFVATPSGTGGGSGSQPAAPSPSSTGVDDYSRGGGSTTASSSPSPTLAPTATARPASTPTPSATPRPTPKSTASPVPTPSATSTPTDTPPPTPKTTPTATAEPTSAGGTAAASIVDFGFTPATLTVTEGTTITWTNTGGAPHTVTADDGSFNSGTLAGGETFSHAFTSKGTFAYHCAIHPSMSGTVAISD